jgi:hypothetical protein
MARSAKNVLKYLFATLTQGSADAFIQASIATAFGVDKTVGVIRSIEVLWPRLGIAANSNAEIYLTTKSFAAVPVFGTDKSILWGAKRFAELATSGGYVNPAGLSRDVWDDDDPFAPIICESTLYAQFDSSNTTLTGTAYLKIGYVEDTMNDGDRFSLQAARLAA